MIGKKQQHLRVAIVLLAEFVATATPAQQSSRTGSSAPPMIACMAPRGNKLDDPSRRQRIAPGEPRKSGKITVGRA
jgi:hypothetical protein